MEAVAEGAAEEAGPGRARPLWTSCGAELQWALYGMEERDVTVLMEAVFDIRSDVRDLIAMLREEEDDDG